jgi:hypothetical protein
MITTAEIGKASINIFGVAGKRRSPAVARRRAGRAMVSNCARRIIEW